MNPIDIRDLALNLNDLIGNDGPGRVRYPLLVTRDGNPEAVIIRHEAYAPRLHDFGVDHSGIVCHHCDPSERIRCDTTSLQIVMQTANQHWRDTHRPTSPKQSSQTGP